MCGTDPYDTATEQQLKIVHLLSPASSLYVLLFMTVVVTVKCVILITMSFSGE